MSLPELLRHEHRFVGCLQVRRIPRLWAGARVLGDVVCTNEDSRQAEALNGQLLHGPLPPGDYVHLSTLAFSYESEARCPALGEDGLCEVHGQGKPEACDVAPLDALVADSLQSALLRARKRESDAWRAGCIDFEPKPGLSPLTRHLSIVDEGAGAALARRRSTLAAEREVWGAAVFRLIGTSAFASGGQLASLGAGSAFTLSLVPVLSVVAAASDACRERILAYVGAQEALIARTVELAIARRNPRDRGDTERLRGFGRALSALRTELTTRPRSGSGASPRTEAWLLDSAVES